MSKPVIMCIDDQREVLSALMKEMSVFEPAFNLEGCESADEAREVLEELDAKGVPVALIISDHVMPGETGIDFLCTVNGDGRFGAIPKILLTGQAGHEDTIRAINEGGIDNYVAKPWDVEDLHVKSRVLVTRFILGSGIDYHPFLSYLDQDTLYKLTR